MKRLIETDDIAATVTVLMDDLWERCGRYLTKDQVRKLYDTQKELFKDGKLIDHKLFEKSLK